MTTYAGQLVQQLAAPGPEWHRCDGSHIQPHALYLRNAFAGLNPNDYARRTGGFMGRLGMAYWRIRLPNSHAAPPWWVSLADDPGAADLPGGTPTAQRPPPGVF